MNCLAVKLLSFLGLEIDSSLLLFKGRNHWSIDATFESVDAAGNQEALVAVIVVVTVDVVVEVKSVA